MALLSQHFFIDVGSHFESMHDCWPRGLRRTCICHARPPSCLILPSTHKDWQLVQSQPIFTLSIISISLPLELTLLGHWDIFSLLSSLSHSSFLLSSSIHYLTLFICFLSLAPAASCLPFHQYMQLVQSRLAFSRSQSALLLS